MTYSKAKKLRYGMIVIDKLTGETIRVIDTKDSYLTATMDHVVICGVGSKQGYNHWRHTAVR